MKVQDRASHLLFERHNVSVGWKSGETGKTTAAFDDTGTMAFRVNVKYDIIIRYIAGGGDNIIKVE